jgi:hypothetical protein
MPLRLFMSVIFSKSIMVSLKDNSVPYLYLETLKALLDKGKYFPYRQITTDLPDTRFCQTKKVHFIAVCS